MARIAPLEPPYAPAVATVLESMMPPGVPPIGLFRTFAKNLPMAEAMRQWGGYELSSRLTLTMRDREIVIDRVCARCGCEYEWGVHVAFFAEQVQLSIEQVASLTHGTADDLCWTSARDRLLVEVVDSLHASANVDARLWDRLVGEFDEAEILDLLMLAGWYHAIAFAANGAGVALEPGAPRFADYS